MFGLVSGGGVTGRSGDAPNALTQSDLTGGGLLTSINALSESFKSH